MSRCQKATDITLTSACKNIKLDLLPTIFTQYLAGIKTFIAQKQIKSSTINAIKDVMKVRKYQAQLFS